MLNIQSVKVLTDNASADSLSGLESNRQTVNTNTNMGH
ncbi:hypothetical protein Nizo2264_2566 [Lactiplantibacillus plantarum]|nr:hypothetical protein Nizo2264_2566 [Lactiplantibacillus plantarum]